MESFANLLRALAALAWPILAAIALFAFRSELRFLINRLKKGKLLGQEFELQDSLQQLHIETTALEARRLTVDSNMTDEGAPSDVLKRILQGAAVSPKAALISLAAELEAAIRRALGHRTGMTDQSGPITPAEALGHLEAARCLPPGMLESAQLFLSVRNQIIHGSGATDDDALKAIDSGLKLLEAINAIPKIETVTVADPAVTVFEDPECQRPRGDVKGVLLKRESAAGSTLYQLFPSTKTHYVNGKEVIWEWGDLIFGTSWYEDPETGRAKQAWAASREFIGRNLDDL